MERKGFSVNNRFASLIHGHVAIDAIGKSLEGIRFGEKIKGL